MRGWVIALALFGCAQSGLEVSIDLKTDIRPGLEFSAVRTVLTDAKGHEIHDEISAFTNQDYLAGERVAELAGVAHGAATGIVTLIDRNGEALISRRAALSLDADTAITLLITGNCIGVDCPLDDPALTECLGGRCVSPECVLENPEACPDPECVSDAMCASPITCAPGACIDGVCFRRADDALCREGEACDPDEGCVVPEVPLDGGVDGGGVDAAFDAAGGCSPSTVCRAAVDECDAAEICDDAGSCPDDVLAMAGAPCAAGICDGLGGCSPCEDGAACSTGNECELGAIRCDADGATCMSAGFVPAGTECRASVGPCDVAESCTGSSPTCPADVRSTAECREAAGPCDLPESCDGSSPDCPDDLLRGAGFVCRGASGDCDVAERCDGTSVGCPGNSFATGGQCRASAGPCDVAESCDGSGPDCPANGFASGNVCNPAPNSCKRDARCTGSSASCPPNGNQPNGTNCGAVWSEHGCNVDVETCQGGVCTHRGDFMGNQPSCGAIGSICGFPEQCCGQGDGYFCATTGGPIYGSSWDCGQCCRVGDCCLGGNPAADCR